MIYIDVDDTLVRNFGKKVIPITHIIEMAKSLYENGAELYCWSSGGAEYAKKSAVQLGIDMCFKAFLPKPKFLIDDTLLEKWKIKQLHPNECRGMNIEELLNGK